MKLITEITVGQEISTKVLNAWLDEVRSRYSKFTGIVRYVKEIEPHIFTVLSNDSLIRTLKLDGFVDFYNKFYNLNITTDFTNTKLQVTPPTCMAMDWPEITNQQLPKDFEVYTPYEVHGQVITKLKQLGGVLEDSEGRKPTVDCWWKLEDSQIQWSYTTQYLTAIPYTELLNLKINKTQNEHNHIIVPTTIATITGGQKHTGTIISGRTCKATIAVGYLSNRSVSA